MSNASLVALSGDLGAGKTTFAQAAAAALGVKESVNSPTFIILKVYALFGQRFDHLIHIDAYRLEGGAELMALGFDDLLRDPGNLILIEWPEHVMGILPEERTNIRLHIVEETVREIEIEP
jgi:tRNA threonylcarbamoyladenosine biosynthesis protein TsaE